MIPTKIDALLENFYRKGKKSDQVSLLVHSKKLNINHKHVIGENQTLDSERPLYMASVGKIFTAALIAMLVEEGKLDFDDCITKILDKNIVDNLAVYNGIDYSKDITIKHLLTHRTGLGDVFWVLVEKLKSNPEQRFSTEELIHYVKDNAASKFAPGKKVHYTDTNYYLLGMIIENITKLPFHEVLSNKLFSPLSMVHSYMLHRSEPQDKNIKPCVPFVIGGVTPNNIAGYSDIDYAGGGVVSTLDDLMIFFKSFIEGNIVKQMTLKRMIDDSYPLFPGIDYGYGIWKVKTIPLLMPKKYASWGVIGATGSFMFYHPGTETIVIGSFNHDHYQRLCVRFILQLIKTIINSQ